VPAKAQRSCADLLLVLRLDAVAGFPRISSFNCTSRPLWNIVTPRGLLELPIGEHRRGENNVIRLPLAGRAARVYQRGVWP